MRSLRWIPFVRISMLRFPLILFVVFCLLGWVAAWAAPGDLDPSFGTGGKVVTALKGGGASSMAIQGDGKIIIAGYFYNGTDNDFAVARYGSDGALDPTFNGTGIVTTDLGGADTTSSVALQIDGKIVVGGTTDVTVSDVALVRYNSDGTLDTSFGTGGEVIANFGSGNADFCSSVAIQGDGKIVAFGNTFDGSVGSFALARYNSDGSMDSSFGTGGKVTTKIGSNYDVDGNAVVIQSDGKIVAVGETNAGNRDVALVRYNSDGTRDSSFGSSGIVTTGLGSNFDDGKCVALQTDGKIVVAGDVYVGSSFVFAVERYNTDGTLDSTFGTNGKVQTDLGNGGGYGHGVAVQADGAIIVVGDSYPASDFDFTLVRYNPDGTLDGIFGAGGKVTTDFAGAANSAASVALQSDGRIVVAGGTVNSTSFYTDFALARYLVTPTPGTTTSAATSVALNAASLHASVNPSGQATMAHFEYGTDPGLSGASSTSDTDLGSGTSVLSLDAVLSGLAAGTTYYFQVVATNSLGTSRGEILSFTTTGGGAGGFSPAVATQDATVVTTESATLNGLVQPNGQSTQGHFEYGTVPGLAGAQVTGDVNLGSGGTGVALAQTISGLTPGTTYYFRALASNGSGMGNGTIQSFTTANVTAITATIGAVPGDPGAVFIEFGAPAVDAGRVGGAATITTSARKRETIIYGGVAGAVLARTDADAPGGKKFTALGDPVFGGEAFGFAGKARPAAASGSGVSGLYSQQTLSLGLKLLAELGGVAPGVSGGQFAKLPSFGLPKERPGLVFTGTLKQGGAISKANDFGVWREKPSGGDSDLLLRNGSTVSLLGGGTREVRKLELMIPVENAMDQRRSFAPDGGLIAAATLADGSSAVLRVMADGSVDAPVEKTTAVPGLPGAEFVKLSAPASGNRGIFALRAALQAIAHGAPPPPRQAIFANRGGGLRPVVRLGDAIPGNPDQRFATLGHPLMGNGGMIGFIAALKGGGVTPSNRKVIVQHRLDDTTAIVAQQGGPAADVGERVVYQKFQSLVVTDTAQGKIVFTGTLAGPKVNKFNRQGMWTVAPDGTAKLILRSDQVVNTGDGKTPRIRLFQALDAKPSSKGQGRSTDATGFVTAKVKLSDGRSGVLRIPLP